MLRSTALYRWLLKYLQALADPARSNGFYAGLTTTEKNDFLTLIQNMERFERLIRKSMRDAEHIDCWPQVSEELRKFHRLFPGYQGVAPGKFDIHVALASIIADSGIDLDKNDIQINSFQVHKLSEPPPQAWFARYNSSQLDRSILFFSVRFFSLDFDEVVGGISATSPNSMLLLHVLAALRSLGDMAHEHVVIVRDGKNISESSAKAAAQMALLSVGQEFHRAQTYTKLPSIINGDEIDVLSRYERLGEVLDVLSDYVERKDLLSKYLSLYHVVETYSFKTPIVQFFRQAGGEMFSLRDFRRLVSTTEKTQGETQHNFFKAVLKEKPDGIKSLEEVIIDRWTALLAGPGVEALTWMRSLKS